MSESSTRRELRRALPRLRQALAARRPAAPSPITNPDYDRVYHYHVRKTAGTSLNAAFWALGGLDLKAMRSSDSVFGRGLHYVRNDRGLITAGDYFFANSHLPAYRVTLPPRTFAVTILRDPSARAVSYYRYLRWAASDAGGSRDPAIRWVREEAEVLGEDFTAFLWRVPERALLAQLSQFSERMDPAEAAAAVLGCDAVCFTETFAADLKELGEVLGIDLVEGHERRFGEEVALAEDERAALRERLAPEYEMLAMVRAGLAATA